MKNFETLNDLENGAQLLYKWEREDGATAWKIFKADDEFYLYTEGGVMEMMIPTSDGGYRGGYKIENWERSTLEWWLTGLGYDADEILG